MLNQVTVYKDRTNIIPVSLGFNVVGEIFTSEIREQPDTEAELIATWDVTFEDGTGINGELILTLLSTVASEIEQTSGYMDIKRMTGGQPVPVFDRPLEVVFRGTVTA